MHPILKSEQLCQRPACLPMGLAQQPSRRRDIFVCLWADGVVGFVWEAWVLSQLMCLLEIAPHVCWEEMAQDSRAAFQVADFIRDPFLPPCKKGVLVPIR